MQDNVGSCEIPEYLSSAESKIGYNSGETFKNRQVKYAAINGMAIFEGDIILGTVEEEERISKENEKLPPDQLRSIAASGQGLRWPDGIIPFTIENNLPNQERVMDAIGQWEKLTFIKFVRHTNEIDFVTFRRERKGDVCASSHIGMAGGQQFITLIDSCRAGAVMHEIGHVLGLWHEHSIEDRNKFVRIVKANIRPGSAYQFEQQITDGDDVGEYDYCSIMHYGRFALCRRQQCPTPPCPCIGPTIEVLQPSLPCSGQIG